MSGIGYVRTKRRCPACEKVIGEGLPWYNHARAHVKRGELIEREINGRRVFMLPAEIDQAEGLLFEAREGSE